MIRSPLLRKAISRKRFDRVSYAKMMESKISSEGWKRTVVPSCSSGPRASSCFNGPSGSPRLKD